jgi:hypothetical protein
MNIKISELASPLGDKKIREKMAAYFRTQGSNRNEAFTENNSLAVLDESVENGLLAPPK